MLTKPELRFKFRRTFCECLLGFIGSQILRTSPTESDDDRLLKATLYQLHERISVRMVKHKNEYTITLPAAQSIALRLLYTSYGSSNAWLNNELRKISDAVHQHYSL